MGGGAGCTRRWMSKAANMTPMDCRRSPSTWMNAARTFMFSWRWPLRSFARFFFAAPIIPPLACPLSVPDSLPPPGAANPRVLPRSESLASSEGDSGDMGDSARSAALMLPNADATCADWPVRSPGPDHRGPPMPPDWYPGPGCPVPAGPEPPNACGCPIGCT